MNDASAARDPLEELAEEFVERHRRGERPSLTEYIRRQPELASEIRELFPALVTLERLKPAGTELGAPAPGAAADTGGTATRTRLGDYRIVREVGRGGMGIVYEAEQISLGRHVALKVLPMQSLLHAKHLQRFQREARAAGRLHHTNIVPVFGVGVEDGLHYYVMQFIPGQGLDQVLTELQRLRLPGPQPAAKTPSAAAAVAQSLLSGAVAATEVGDGPSSGGSAVVAGAGGTSALSEAGQSYWRGVARIGVQVAEALAYAHGQGVLHRDVKPSNLLLDTRGTVWVADFGLAKAADQDDVTMSGDLVGTLRYMPPERFRGPGDARSDVYALGLSLYELLTLRPAYNTSERNALIHEILHNEPVAPRRVNPAVPRDLETIVLKAMARDPALRYGNAADLAEDLRRFAEDRPILARRARLTERAWRWCRKNRALAAALAMIALTLVGGSVVALVLALQAQGAAGEAETARLHEAEAKARALALLDAAKDARDELQQHLYAAEMTLAGQAADSVWGLGLAGELLEHWYPRPGLPDRRGWEWYYLHGMAARAALVLRQHNKTVWAVRWSPDGTRIASGSLDGTVRVSESRTGRTIAVLRDLGGEVQAVGWSGDGKRLAVAGQDSLLRAWEVDAAMAPVALRGHRGTVFAVAWSPDGSRLASAGQDGIIRTWDVAGAKLNAIRAHDAPIRALSWNPDGTRLASAALDHQVRIWDVASGQELLRFDGHPSWVLTVAWSPDGSRIASAGIGETILVWDAESGEQRSALRGHAERVWAVAWSPDGKRLASGGIDSTLRLWDADTAQEVDRYRGHTGQVVSVDWSPDGARLATGSTDPSLCIWDADSRDRPDRICRHNSPVSAACWSPDGRRLATGCDDGTIALWDAAGKRPVRVWKAHQHRVTAIDWQPGGTQLASGGVDRSVRLWDADSARELRALPRPDEVKALAWRPDGRRLAIGERGGPVRVWDPDAAGEPMALLGHQGEVLAVAWHPDGRRLASAGWDLTVRLWDTQTGTATGALEGHSFWVHALAWSPDGKRLASAAIDRSIRIWEHTEDPHSTNSTALTGHARGVTAVQWSPDGRRLASAGQDHTVKLWDVATGRSVLTIAARGELYFARWSPDGSRLAAGGTEPALYVWDALAGMRQERAAMLGGVLDRWVAADTQNVPELRLRAEVRARRGDWDGAAEDWNRAVRFSDGSLPPWLRAGWWLTDADAADANLPSDNVHDPRWCAGPDSESGWLPLGRLMPGRTAYALARIYVSHAQPAAMHLSGMAATAFLNGQQLPKADRDPIILTLRSGWNTLLLRAVAAEKNDHIRFELRHEPAERLTALLASGRHDEAAGMLRATLEGSPDAPALVRHAARWHQQQSEALQRRGKHADATAQARQAERHYERLRTLVPDHAADAAELADLVFARAQEWTTFVPAEMTSEGGAMLLREPDGSIFVRGKNPEQDRYILSGPTGVAAVHAVRLQTLPDVRLPQRGPGRYPGNGNFLLSELTLLATAGKDGLTELQIAASWADAAHAEGPIAHAVDGKPATAWNTWPHQHVPHSAVFLLRTPAGPHLTVRLDFRDERWGRHGLGHFRLAVSSRPHVLQPVRWQAALVGPGVDPRTRLAAAYACCDEWPAVQRTLAWVGAQWDTAAGVEAALLALAHDRLGDAAVAQPWRVRAAAWLNECDAADPRQVIVRDVLHGRELTKAPGP
jgi:WD40 repeat protein/serine/threonine protein kinase